MARAAMTMTIDGAPVGAAPGLGSYDHGAAVDDRVQAVATPAAVYGTEARHLPDLIAEVQADLQERAQERHLP
ncbi:MAG: hypothetical protein GEU73_17650 [Chloroflexi bacterium]|nr:hypothetical protein [Chloroflexota bacterium]